MRIFLFNRKVLLYLFLSILLFSSLFWRIYLNYFNFNEKKPEPLNSELINIYQSQMDKFLSSNGEIALFIGMQRCPACVLLKKQIESLKEAEKTQIIYFVPQNDVEEFNMNYTLRKNGIYVNFVPMLLKMENGKIERFWGYNEDEDTVNSDTGQRIKLKDLFKKN